MEVAAAFREWLGQHAATLPVSIIELVDGPGALAFSLQGWPDLRAVIAHGGLAVQAIRDGRCWDLLLDLDAAPEDVEGGVACLLCTDGRIWPSRDVLWADHLWEPLRTWLGELAASSGIEWGGEAGGSTWARLERR